MSKTRASIRSGGRALAMVMTATLVVAALTVTVAPAATSTFTAVGSARQVYVTGLAPSMQMALVNGAGAVVESRNANSLGGLLFRDVPPAAGYRVRRVSDGVQSGKITVHSESAAPWNPEIYDQTIPSNGYTYLTTRDGTKLAVSVHPPTSPAGEPGLPPGIPTSRTGPAFAPALPDADRVLGVRIRQPGGTDERHRGAREPDGLRRRRREHARDRLLGWRLRLLRAAAEPRRLRRDRDDRPPTVGARSQGRDDGHLLRRRSASCSRPSSSRRRSRPSHRSR